ncbi:Ca2+-binding EF-hand superfamily protein [Streptosporangium becharense]|uniref:Ca2+-binding EF-hand superfamily protein n=1 Tax=Streptosporangium becharense TaxID=1816182 RepID=A0A7W9MHX5_9ACTN|nr:EF-hand domain-containing protein [Streptosporangium becharense]MBB2914695.1 Ca2+-binding EF-hand superfamily protein [Streptosporangium becharense]MBB5820904.1 Ca2+-binding EF-hand superfamily protein [Streptosporangium becharense]
MNPEALERVRLRFAMLDENSNGYLEADDFERLAHRMVRAVAEPPDSEKALAVVEGHRRYWQGLVGEFDADGDRRISLEEYLARVSGPDHYEGVIREYAESLADLADVDDDGFIERSDFVSCMRAAGFEADGVDAAFDALDPTGAGRITTDAWVNAIRDYYASDRTDIPAQHLLDAADIG